MAAKRDTEYQYLEEESANVVVSDETSFPEDNIDESCHMHYQIEALKILKEINTSKTDNVKTKSFAALTCEMIQLDMETLSPLEQRSLRNRLLEVVDEAVNRHHPCPEN